MWSGPRNISTAMMRAWENRGDCTVSDEPLYAAYLAATGLDHPGRDEVIAAGDTDWRRVATDTDQVPEVDLKKYPHGGMLCPLGPYGDFFIDVLAEIATRYPSVAAYSFDGLHYAGSCYCGSCKAACNSISPI